MKLLYFRQLWISVISKATVCSSKAMWLPSTKAELFHLWHIFKHLSRKNQTRQQIYWSRAIFAGMELAVECRSALNRWWV